MQSEEPVKADRMLSTSEAAERLGLSEATVRHWIRSGKIQAQKEGRRYLVSDQAIQRLQNALAQSTFVIPVSVEQGPPVTSAGWDQARVLKARDAEYSGEDLYTLSGAIAAYLFDKEFPKPGRSWQDYILTQQLLHRVVQEQIRRRVENGEPFVIAQLKTVFMNFPDVTMTAAEAAAVNQFVADAARSHSDTSYSDLAAYVFKTCNVPFPLDELKPRNNMDELETQKTTFLSLGRDRVIGIVEGVVASLIAAGIFELLKESLASLVIRAPYTEAQIYEVECDVLRTRAAWEKAARRALKDVRDLTPDAKATLVDVVLHALVVAAVYGANLPCSPVCRTPAAIHSESEQDLLARWQKRFKFRY